MVDQYAPDPDQWWAWYATLPDTDEKIVSKEYALRWVKRFAEDTPEGRKGRSYILWYDAVDFPYEGNNFSPDSDFSTETPSFYLDEYDASTSAVVIPPDNDKFLPTGGYEHEYNEELWGGSVITKANCYAYVLNTYSKPYDIKYRPSYVSHGESYSADYIKRNIITLLRDDADYYNHKKIVATTATTKPGYRQYKIAAVFSYDRDGVTIADYHFYRQDKGGYWSHKRGYDLPISNIDASSNKIIDPKACSRNYESSSYYHSANYRLFSGYFMVTY